MSNDRRYFFKLLGLIQIEITNISPKELIKILWAFAGIILLAILFAKVINYIAHTL